MRVAVLIISSDEKERWILEKSIWKQYMNSHKEVDCFFLETDLSIPSKSVKVSDNHIQVGCEDGILKGIFRKTILALQYLDNKYDFYIRTNLSTFWRFNLLLPLLNNIDSKGIFYGGWAWKDYISGFAIILNKKACSLLVKEGMKHYDEAGRDDVLIGKIMRKISPETSHTPLNNKCFYWGYEDLPIKDAIKKIKCDNRCIIRTLPHGEVYTASTYSPQKEILQKLIKEFNN